MTRLKSVRKAALAALMVGALSFQAQAADDAARGTVLKAARMFDAAGEIVSPSLG